MYYLVPIDKCTYNSDDSILQANIVEPSMITKTETIIVFDINIPTHIDIQTMLPTTNHLYQVF